MAAATMRLQLAKPYVAMQYRLCESADDMMALMLQKWDSPDTGHPPIKYSGSIVGKFRAVRKLFSWLRLCAAFPGVLRS